LVQTKKKKKKKHLVLVPISVQIANFITKPKDTEPKGTGTLSQPDWSDFMTYCLFRDGTYRTSKTMLCAEINALVVCAQPTYDGILASWELVKSL